MLRPLARDTEDQTAFSEKRTKQILGEFLASAGWEPQIGWGPSHGVDIEAKRGAARWVIEVKVPEPPTMVVEAFVSVLGKILQRMHDPGSKYSIAVPDAEPFHRLWERLPITVKKRVGITALFVSSSGKVTERTE